MDRCRFPIIAGPHFMHAIARPAAHFGKGRRKDTGRKRPASHHLDGFKDRIAAQDTVDLFKPQGAILSRAVHIIPAIAKQLKGSPDRRPALIFGQIAAFAADRHLGARHSAIRQNQAHRRIRRCKRGSGIKCTGQIIGQNTHVTHWAPLAIPFRPVCFFVSAP